MTTIGSAGPPAGSVRCATPKIAVGRQAAVQLDFPAAGAFALLRGAEVEKVGQYRFFRLECPVTGQHHHTRVSFVHIDVGHRGHRR